MTGMDTWRGWNREMRHARAGVLLVGAFLVTGCASSGGGSDPELVGCYQFHWDEQARELGLPWGFELLPGELAGWSNVPDARIALTRTGEGGTRDHPFRYWSTGEGDTVRIGHPGGGGFALALVPEGRNLVGTARPVGDVVMPGQQEPDRSPRPVMAYRVVCDTE